MSSAERQLGVDLFNETWRRLESRDDDDRLLHCAHASAYHWSLAPECKPENRARSEWLCSRVYSVLGRAEPALWHGRRCLDICEANGIGDWDLAYAFEAIARGYGVAGERPELEAYKTLAREAGDKIGEAEDREHFAEDFATL
jgi:hypothetical protein